MLFLYSLLLPHFLIIFLFLIVALFSFPENLFFSHFYYISITDSHYTAKHRNKKGSKQNRKPIPGTEKEYNCDTVILSVGLIPENELSIDAGVTLDARTKGAVVDEYFQTEKSGFFAAGNVLHVHDLVDFVSMEAEKLADGVAEYVENGSLPELSLIHI